MLSKLPLAPVFPNPITPYFGSCEELRAHGVEMDGHYMIDGTETYCKDTWSKHFNHSLVIDTLDTNIYQPI